MKWYYRRENCRLLWIKIVMAGACLLSVARCTVAQNPPPTSSEPPVVASHGPMAFASPQEAAEAVIAAAKKFDVAELVEIFGVGGEEIVLSGDFARDREHATDFAKQAEEKQNVSVDPKTGTRCLQEGNQMVLRRERRTPGTPLA